MLQSLWFMGNTFIIVGASYRTLSTMSMPLLYWGTQRWTQYSRCGLNSAEERGRITSLNLLATLHLMKPRIPSTTVAARAHCWLMFILVSTMTPMDFSAKLLSRRSASSIYWCLGLFLPRCRTLHFALLAELHEVPVSSFLQPVKVPLDQPLLVQHCLQTCLSFCPIIQVTNTDIKQEWSQYCVLGCTTSYGLQLDSVLLIITLQAQLFIQF